MTTRAGMATSFRVGKIRFVPVLSCDPAMKFVATVDCGVTTINCAGATEADARQRMQRFLDDKAGMAALRAKYGD